MTLIITHPVPLRRLIQSPDVRSLLASYIRVPIPSLVCQGVRGLLREHYLCHIFQVRFRSVFVTVGYFLILGHLFSFYGFNEELKEFVAGQVVELLRWPVPGGKSPTATSREGEHGV